MVHRLLNEPGHRNPWCSIFVGCLVAGVLAACGGGENGDTQDPNHRATGVAIVGIEGGTVLADDGAQVEIPAAAAFSTFEAAISKDSSGAPPLADGMAPVGATYALTPHGVRFTQPVRVTLPFDPAAVPEGATVAIARANPGGRWTLLPATVQGRTVSTLTEGFSFYVPVVMGRASFQLALPLAEFTLQGQTSIAAQSPPALYRDGTPVESIPTTNFQVLTQAQIATPISLTMRGAIPAGSDVDVYCGTRPARLVVQALYARVYPDPANAARTLVRTNYQVVDRSLGFVYDEPMELASMPLLRDGVSRSQTFQVNLANYGYTAGPNEYPLDPFTGNPIAPSIWNGVNPLPQTGATGLRLFLKLACSDVLGWTEYTTGPEVALRRGYPNNVGFTDVPVAVVAVEGEAATFRARANGPIDKWQRSFSGAPDLWLDIPVSACNSLGPCEWEYVLPADPFAPFNPNDVAIRKTGLTRGLDNGTRIRAVVCPYSGAPADCVPSPPALLTVTQDFVAPQVTLNPVPLLTVTENAANAVTQFSASFSGVPSPTVRWETKAPGSSAWAPVDAAVYRLNGNTLSTTRSFTLADRGREFRAVGSNGGGSASTFSTTLFVTTGLEAPSVSAQPQDASVNAGTAAVLAASINGSSPMSYQWYFNGTAITGANGPVLALNNVNAGNAGLYLLEAGNRENAVRSRAARLTVVQASGGTTPANVAPAIVTAPSPVSVNVNNTATFAVVASGSAPLRYQWLKNGSPIGGASGAILTLPQVALSDAGGYSVVVANAGGEIKSAEVTLGVAAPTPPQPATPPVIYTQPTGLVVIAGQGATFAIAASGSAPLAYQWQRNGVAIAGATGPILTLTTASMGDVGQYSVVVSNGTGSATSQVAGLVVTPLPGAPSISSQPGSASVVVGQTAAFTLAVTGNPSPQCQWTRNSVAINGATSCTGYTTPTTVVTDNGAVYNVVVYSSGGVAIGNGAVLTVQPGIAPTITVQPLDWSTSEGGQAQFSGVASGTPLLGYEWLIDGAVLPPLSGNYAQGPCTFAYDALGGNFALGSVSLGCNGRVVTWRVTNTFGSVTSNPAVLSVAPAVPANAMTATQIVAGQEWSLVLRPDRSVWAWGNRYSSNGYFESGTGNLTTTWGGGVPSGTDALRPVRIYPAALTDIRAISGWYDSFWAIKGNPGTTGSRVLHWGWARSGADGRGTDGNGSPAGSVPQYRYNHQTPVEVLTGPGQPVDRVCAIAGGADRLLLIRAIDDANLTTDCAPGSAKTVWMVGSVSAIPSQSTGVAQKLPGLPQSGSVGYSPPSVVFQQLGNTSPDVAAIALEDGRAFGMGNNVYNGFGLSPPSFGTLGPSPAAPLPTTWGTVRGFGSAFYYSLFTIRSDGSVMASGYDGNGELGLGNPGQGQVNGPLPVLAETCTSLPCANVLTGVSAVESMYASLTTLALKNGQILGWGVAGNGLLGPGLTGAQRFPRPVPSTVSGFTALSASWAHALVIGPGNMVYAWGSGLRGALGNGINGGATQSPDLVTVP